MVSPPITDTNSPKSTSASAPGRMGLRDRHLPADQSPARPVGGLHTATPSPPRPLRHAQQSDAAKPLESTVRRSMGSAPSSPTSAPQMVAAADSVTLGRDTPLRTPYSYPGVEQPWVRAYRKRQRRRPVFACSTSLNRSVGSARARHRLHGAGESGLAPAGSWTDPDCWTHHGSGSEVRTPLTTFYRSTLFH